MESRLKKHLDKLHAFDNERRAWLVLSAFVVISVLIIILGWDAVTHSKIIYLVGTIGLILSVTWWYWTMRLIRYLVHYKTTEAVILQELVEEIHYIKQQVDRKISGE